VTGRFHTNAIAGFPAWSSRSGGHAKGLNL
jgi:hypothetical protein